MNLPPPITDCGLLKHKTTILAAAIEEPVKSRRIAAQELHWRNTMSNDDILDITVTCDGTWAKQSFTSQFDFVMFLSWESGQVNVYEVKVWSWVQVAWTSRSFKSIKSAMVAREQRQMQHEQVICIHGVQGAHIMLTSSGHDP